MRTKNSFKKKEVIVVAALLSAISLMTLPKFSRASTDDRINTLCSHLQTMRSQLSLYHLQHNNRWPSQEAFADQMTRRTNAGGQANPVDGIVTLGPYLDRIPANPFTGGNSVNGGDWLYDERTGQFLADDGGSTQGMLHKNL